MNFEGYLISFPKTGKLFPHKYIERESYKSTPLQRTELKAYRDGDNGLHRITSPNYKTKIEFNTLEINLAALEEIQLCLRTAMVNSQQRKLRLKYWDEELLNYREAFFYMPDKTYNTIFISSNDIKYAPIPFTFIEY